MLSRRTLLKFIPASLLPASVVRANPTQLDDSSISTNDPRLTVAQRKFIDNVAYLGLSAMAAYLRPAISSSLSSSRGRHLETPVAGALPLGICLLIPLDLIHKPLAHTGLQFMQPSAASIADAVLEMDGGEVYEMGFDYSVERGNILAYLYSSRGASEPSPGFIRHRTMKLSYFGLRD